MSDIDKLVENYFRSKDSLGVGNLLALIEKEAESFIPKQDLLHEADKKATEKSILDFLPPIQITEDWGDPKAASRKTFEKYMNNIRGDGLPEKIASINDFVDNAGTERLPVSDILSNLVFLELLSTVIQQFSPSGSGFIFEAFLAGILRGKQVTEQAEGSLPIEDIMVFTDPETGEGGRAVSLKLLSADTKVSGSITNLLKWLARDSENQGIEYVIAVKFGDKELAFYSITITKENVLDWIGDWFNTRSLRKNIRATLKESLSMLVTEEEMSDEDKENLQRANDEFNRISVVAGMEGQQARRGRGSKLQAIEMAKSAPEELVDQIIQYASEAGLNPNRVNKIMFPPSGVRPEAGDPENTIDWDAALKGRRELLKKIRRTLSSKHILGLPDVEAPDVKGKSGLSSEEKAFLTQLANEDPQEWFKIMIGAATETQFHIDPKFYRTRNLPASMQQKRYGSVNLDKARIRDAATSYNEQLKDIVIPLYEALASFNNNLTKYYLEHDLQGASEAAQNAVTLKVISSELATQAEESKEIA